MAETIAIIGAVTAAAGTAFSVVQGRKAAKGQEKARNEQRKLQELEEQRRRRAQIRERRQRVGALINAGGVGGSGESSGVFGGRSSINSQFSSNSGFLSQSKGLTDNVSSFSQSAADAQGRAQIGSGLSSVGATLFNNAGTIDRTYADYFGGVSKSTGRPNSGVI